MENDPLNSGGGNPPEVRPSREKLNCEFCGCQLTSKGDVLTMSETAKKYRDQKDSHEKAVSVLNEQIVVLTKERDDLKRTQPAPAAATPSKSFLDS